MRPYELSRGYEAGNVLAVQYFAGSVPGDDQLDADLTRLVGL
jgi:hypothetical protein